MDLFGSDVSGTEMATDKAVISDLDSASPSMNQHGAVLFESPQTMPFCIGHEKIEHDLLQAYMQNSIPHSLVFNGQKGIGKATFAFRLTRFLMNAVLLNTAQDSLFAGDESVSYTSMDVAYDSLSNRQIASGAHPDLLYIERAYDSKTNKRKRGVDVDEIRKINNFLHKTSSYGGWRVVIVDDADTMNRNAQNAILKILEEPPKHTVIIMIAHRMGTFLPTIRSRVSIVNFAPLDDESLKSLLYKADIHDQHDSIMRYAQGSFEKALAFQSDMFQDVFAQVQSLHSGNLRDSVDHHAVADAFGRGESSAGFDVFETVLLSMIASDIQSAAYANDVSDLMKGKIDLYDEIKDLFEQTRTVNLDKRQAILQVCQRISATV